MHLRAPLLPAAALALAALAVRTGAPRAAPPPPAAPPPGSAGCLPTGDGFLRARIRGALNLDLDWHNADLECEGGARPGGRGIRVSFAGRASAQGPRLRLVFGVASVGEGAAARGLPTNVTLIVEGQQRVFSTRGDDRCTTDAVEQLPIEDPGRTDRNYRVLARGFCVQPAEALAGSGRILVSRFDFAGRLGFTESRPPGQRPRPQVVSRVAYNASESAP